MMDRFERAHCRRVDRYARALVALLERAAREAAWGAARLGCDGGEEAFRFARYPALQRRLDLILRGLHRAALRLLAEGSAREWDAAEAGADALAREYCRALGRGPTAEEAARWFGRAGEARAAFLARGAAQGRGLSARVWRLTEGFAREVEAALAEAIAEGTPAEALAGRVKARLNEPGRLFRRVRGADGALRPSRAARAYHPGAGVYRSSYMNARRLAATETNMAYRAADHARWQRMDFVEGVEVRLSNNHSCRGVRAGAFHDICDELAGRYPKAFRFVGWHPLCRCHAVPLLRAPGAPAGEARAMPPAFAAWAQRNEARIARSAARGALPYFLRDNFRVGETGRLEARWEGAGASGANGANGANGG